MQSARLIMPKHAFACFEDSSDVWRKDEMQTIPKC